MSVVGATQTVVLQEEKPGKFHSVNFNGWKRVFLMIIEAWKPIDFQCKGYIFNALRMTYIMFIVQ